MYKAASMLLMRPVLGAGPTGSAAWNLTKPAIHAASMFTQDHQALALSTTREACESVFSPSGIIDVGGNERTIV
jgi:hypothetical protein